MPDDLIPWARVPEHIPGRRVNPATLHRWRTRGIAGEKLQVEPVGGRVFVSRAELDRFFAAVKAKKNSGKPKGASPETASRRGKVAAAKRRVSRTLTTKKSRTAAA